MIVHLSFIIGFDYIGDAVWMLAWRKFERDRFKRFTGWHRCLRSQIVTSNQFMGMVALAEGITPMGEGEKALPDGLEHLVGEYEAKKAGEGVRLAMFIMQRRVKVHKIQRYVDQIIKNHKGQLSMPQAEVKEIFVNK